MNHEKTSIIFVVEQSLPMKMYITEMIDSYISHALANFCGGLNEDTDIFFHQCSAVQFGVVFFGCDAWLGHGLGRVVSVGPTPSVNAVLTAIKGAKYTNLNNTRQACIVEGLQSALTFFSQMDKMAASHGSLNSGNSVSDLPNSSKKFCVLVTQSSPVIHPWNPNAIESTVKNLKNCGVKLSVIACHRLPELYRIFELGGGDLSVSSHKNYGTKPQHLVLLSGFVLPEHDNPPLVSHNTSGNTSLAPQQQQQQQSPAGNRMNLSPQHSSAAGAASPSAQQQQQMSQPSMRSAMPSMNQHGNRAPVAKATIMRPGAPNQPRPRWPMSPSPDLSPAAKGMNIQQMAPSNISSSSQMVTSNLQVPTQMGTPNLQNLGPAQQPTLPVGNLGTQQRTVVWQGTLELQEKKDAPMVRANYQIPCKMTTSIVNGEPEVKAEGWPAKLVLHLIPKGILSPLGNSCFKQVHTVMFLPEPCPALTVLSNHLSRSMAGCVYPTNSNVNLRMIILLYSSEKDAYVGFIPIDQQSFIAKMKTVMHSQRAAGPLPRPNAPETASGTKPKLNALRHFR
ncbi:mediator of RNA polymerase II transcription subunit 25 [Hyalella azteca]|uniref:Mediator of RNA polymerase II transcription subunit 25 n=1 Tax=Hyalella azteca TaxID=294128 RepID=A0A8B7P1P6_HYAAZ|nr:mediator of RNA polymerase II transcription subunit 25 [Hyalella azteca]